MSCSVVWLSKYTLSALQEVTSPFDAEEENVVGSTLCQETELHSALEVTKNQHARDELVGLALVKGIYPKCVVFEHSLTTLDEPLPTIAATHESTG
jgi:hypothetical protein